MATPKSIENYISGEIITVVYLATIRNVDVVKMEHLFSRKQDGKLILKIKFSFNGCGVLLYNRASRSRLARAQVPGKEVLILGRQGNRYATPIRFSGAPTSVCNLLRLFFRGASLLLVVSCDSRSIKTFALGDTRG